MSNDITTTNSAVPAHLQQTSVSGFVEDDSALLSPPRIKLIQKSSKEFDEDPTLGGKFFNTGINQPSDEVIFTPIKSHIEYMTFDDDGNMSFRSDSEDEAKEALGEEYWKARRINILALPNDCMMPAVYSFSGSAYKVGTKLYQLCKAANPGCMFSKAYKLTSNEHEGPGGKYWTPSVVVAKNVDGYSDDQGWLTEDAFNAVREVAESL